MIKLLLVLFLGLNLYGDIVETLTIKHNNKLKEIKVKKEGELYIAIHNDSLFYYNDKSTILVLFANDRKPVISNFATKYNLKFKKRLVVGYYIYEVNDNINEIIRLLTKDANIISVSPNWSAKVELF